MKKAIILYIPVLHQGYMSLFESQKPIDTIFLIDHDLVAPIDAKLAGTLKRDMRALPTSMIKNILENLSIARAVDILSSKTLDSFDQIIVPSDEVTEMVFKYLQPDVSFTIENIFLRWNWKATQYQNPVMPDRVVSNSDVHKELMGIAFGLAEKSSDWWRQVGTLIVNREGKFIEAFNHHLPHADSVVVNGDPRSNFDAGQSIEISTAIHGEASAISYAAKNGVSLNGATLYVTVFPCPVCARLIVESGIKRVYYCDGYSRLDALDLFKGNDIEVVHVSK